MDLIAGLLELIGLYIIGYKQKVGFAIGACGNIVWIIYVISTHSTYGLLVVCIPAFVINLSNYKKWSKNHLDVRLEVPHYVAKSFWNK